MAAGIYTVLVPKFINETAPSELKGPFGAMSQLLVTFGIFLTALVCIKLPYFTFSQQDSCQIIQVQVDRQVFTSEADIASIVGAWSVQSQWRLVWGIPSVLAIVQSLLVVFVFNFETPYHLKKTEQWEKLEQLMALIYHKSHV